MAVFKTPDFNARTAAAREAKQRALDQLRAKPAPDPVALAAREEARAARERAQSEKRAARIEEARLEKARAAEAKASAATAAAAAASPPPLSEAERKALRDARYALRKARRR